MFRVDYLLQSITAGSAYYPFKDFFPHLLDEKNWFINYKK